MKKKINKIVSCLLVLVLLVNVFAFESMTVFADEQKNTAEDIGSAVGNATGGVANVGDLEKETRGEDKGELAKAQKELDQATKTNDDNVNGQKTNSLAGLTAATSKVQSALIKVGTKLEKIGSTLKKIGSTLKTIGSALSKVKLPPWVAAVGKALVTVGKIVYQVGNVLENIGKTIRTVGEAAQGGDFNFGKLFTNVVSSVKDAWVQGGVEYDNLKIDEGMENGILGVFKTLGGEVKNDNVADPASKNM